MTATARLAEFIVKTPLEDCPNGALVEVRRAALDTIGVMLAGAGEPAARIVRQIVRVEGGMPLCTVLGTSLRTSSTWAALANGVAGHAHDFDDTSFGLMGHPSAPLLATALAAGEAEMVDGAAISVAYILGFEVDAALGIALNPAHYERGWHATTSLGTFGCTAVAAKLLSLDITQTRHALGLAASFASGVKENFGSMTKPYHAGHAARNGVLAAQLAREGFTASDSALDGPQGFLHAAGDGLLPESALDALGRTWQVVTSKVAVKPYPSCALTHSAIDALLELRERHALDPAQVESVEVAVNHVVPNVLRHARPITGLERKFSMQFCAASALAEGRVDIGSFSDGPAPEPVAPLMERIRMIVDPTLPHGLDQHAWTRVTVRLADGRTLAEPVRGASGHPATPLTDDQLRAKFMACATTAISRDEAEGVAEQIDRLEAVPDIRVLTARLVGTLE
jgi:2-methylcitrate dehydratase PrpD